MRLIGRYSYQYVRFGEQAYDFPADAERYLAHMASRDGDFDSPEDLPEQAWLHGLGLGVEFGAAAINYDFYVSGKRFPVLSQHQLSVAMLVPWRRLVKMIRLNGAVKRASKAAAAE